MGRRKFMFLLPIAAIAVILSGCGSSSDSSLTPSGQVITDPPPQPGPEAALLEAVGDVVVQAAYDNDSIALRFSWMSHEKTSPAGFANVGQIYPGQFHDMMRWNGTEFDRLPSGQRMDEDRVTFMIEDAARSVTGFAKAGCFVACHDNMFAADNASDHNVDGFLDHWHWRGGRSGPMGYAEDAHVDAATRQRDAAGTPPSAWIRSGGDRLREDQAALADTGHPLAEGLPRFVFNKGKHMAGGFQIPAYFLALEDGTVATDPYSQFSRIKDVGHNRSLLVVFQDRGFDPVDKVNAIDLGFLVYVATGHTGHLPAHLRPDDAAFNQDRFDSWAAFWSQELEIDADPDSAATRQAAEAIITAIHQDWDEVSSRQAMVTRSVGFIYESDQHDISSSRSFHAEEGIWSVTLLRKLETGSDKDTNLAALKTGTMYNLSFAMHDVGGGHDSHHISFPFTLGIDPTADIQAVQVMDAKTADWTAVPVMQTRIFQPQEKTWEWLTSAAHPGAGVVGTVHCRDCHQAGGMAPPLNP